VDPKYWSEVERSALRGVTTYKDMAGVALDVLRAMIRVEGDKQIVEVCAPISSGGFGNRADNELLFHALIKGAANRGFLVFDQMPFQEAMDRISPEHNGCDIYCTDILNVFYNTIFESGYISMFLFGPFWHTSRGARWERERSMQLKIPRGNYNIRWLSLAWQHKILHHAVTAGIAV
jgi:hypothetical protein